MSTGTRPQESLIVLWAGEDPAVHAALLESLDAVGIPYKNLSLGDDEVPPTANPLPVEAKPRFGFEVAVPSGDVTAARQILEKILDQEPADLEIPAQDSAPSQPEPEMVSETELHPNAQVWFGTDDKIAQFLTVALQENEIPIHLETADGTRISVSSANEARAREIVREVTEAEPPK
jgi:hypothetical protein